MSGRVPSPSPSSATPTRSPPPSISPFLAQTAAGGIRYPVFAQVQGSPLLYSPSLFGQSMLPWRLGPGSPTSTASSSSPQPPTSTPSLLSSLTGLTQLSGLVYPVVPSHGQMDKLSGSAGSHGADGVNKRRAEGSLVEMELKRPRLSDSAAASHHSPSTSSHPHTSAILRRQQQQQQQQQQQAATLSSRSPVIKFIPYNPGQSVVLPPGVVAAQRAAAAAAASAASSLPQALYLPTLPSQGTAPTSIQHQLRPLTATPPSASNAVHAPPNVTVETIKKLYKLPVVSNISSMPNQSVVSDSSTSVNHSSLAGLKIVLLKCFGPMQSTPDAVFNQNLIVSNLLQDLYRPSYFTTSDYANPPLSPESCALLTICYLTSLRRGETISTPSIRAMMHYAQIGELDWLNYYKKHKKMSESTFVQAQLMHLSRVAVYPVLGRVRVMISNQSLADGISQTLQTLAQLASISRQNLPDYVVVMAIRPSSSVDFCILVLEALQVQILIQLSGMESKLHKLHMSAFHKSSLPDLHVDKNLAAAIRSIQKKNAGKILIPFYSSKALLESEWNSSNCPGLKQLRMDPEKAAELIPDAPHVIEHKPQGPFQDQYGMATSLLQYLWGAKMKIENFQKIDFCILCPPDASFVSQTVAMVADSGLADELELYLGGDNARISAISQRVICCNCVQDTRKFHSFLAQVEANPLTLYVVIAENGHMTSTIATGLISEERCCPDNWQLLFQLENTVVLHVSAHPFTLLTNKSFLSYHSEVHWPIRSQTTDTDSLGDLAHFCSANNFRQDVTNQIDYRVRFREDASFEEMFHHHCATLGSSAPVSLATIRAELLLNEYVRALMFASGCPGADPALPDTQELVSRLVLAPLERGRGRGAMVLVRSHDCQVGVQFYRNLKSARNSLGLQFRFEVLFDDGSHFITPSSHFLARTVRKGRGCSYGNEHRDHVMSYQELEGVPCVVVLAGRERANLSFPESLLYVDLRMCYLTPLTRGCYDYDTSFFNGYRMPVKKTTPPPELTNHRSPSEAAEVEDSDCDVEVFDGSHDQAVRPIKLSCSSGSLKSSTDEGDEKKSPNSTVRHSVVEWKPGNGRRERDGSSSMTSLRSGDDESAMEDHNSYPGTVTVTIDPPADPLLYSREGSDSLTPPSYSNDARLPFQALPPEEVGGEDGLGGGGREEGEGGEDSDSEDEPFSRTTPNRLCLLSRSYYHIWCSHSPQAHLLLPPAQGVDWHGSTHRPPLFDTDPHQQSAYYHKWSKPACREARYALDKIMKECTRKGRRPFLLSGPAQVGKTGAWLLMVRLLHDILRSSQGVVVENLPPPTSVFLPDPPPPPRSEGSHSSAPLLGGSHSSIVSLSYLKDVYKKCEDEEELKVELHGLSKSVSMRTEGVSTATISDLTPSDSRHTLLLPVSPFMAYDYAHSCADCTKHLRANSAHNSELLTFKLPFPRTKSHVTLKWHVPAPHHKHCVLSTDRRSLDRLKIPVQRKNTSISLTPLFTLSIRRDSSALLNLFHSLSPSHLHVVVILASEFDQYCKLWPGHLILVMPEQVQSKGAMFQVLCDFIRHNLQLNAAALRHEAPGLSVWPMAAIVSDSVAMFKKVDAEGRFADLSLSQLLSALEQDPATPSLAALSLLPWSHHLEQDISLADSLTNFDLSHDFLLLNFTKFSSLAGNEFTYNASAVDFNLKLQATGQNTALRKDYIFVKKHIANSGSLYPLHTQLSGLCPSVDKLVISLHHDSSSLLPQPGPYLMEHYLLHKSSVLFPYAHYSKFPVLVVDNYVSLGPRTHVAFTQSNMLRQNSFLEQNGLHRVKFGGLLLYLCEGNLASDQLQKLSFVSGACLCLVTRDCKALIREVARLDLEERWKFRLRDEYQTACGDHLRPLFFLTGCFEK